MENILLNTHPFLLDPHLSKLYIYTLHLKNSKNFIKSNNIPLRGDNTKLLYNGQCKSTTLIQQGEFVLILIR